MRPKYPVSYFSAESMLRGKRERRLSANTRVCRLSPVEISVRLHDTDIVRFKLNGSILLNSGGWRTVTTKRRMNQCLLDTDWSIGQQDGEWYLFGISKRALFEDGCVIDSRAES